MGTVEEKVRRMRLAQVQKKVPKLLQRSGTCLYIGAHPRRFHLGEELHRAGYRITLLEVWGPNARHYRKHPYITDVIEGKVEDVLPWDRTFDVTVWWHGPEHIERSLLPETLGHIEAITRRLVVLGCPWGINEQGPEYGNPFEKHLSYLYEADFAALDYAVDTLGHRDAKWSNLLAWKHLRASPAQMGFKKEPRPWLAPGAQEYLEKLLTKDMKVFEWGSGESTVWLAQQVGDLVSVEHQLGWHAKVHHELEKRGLLEEHSSCLVIPAYYSPSEGDTPYEDYVWSIWHYPPGYFDAVFVDGRERVRCIEKATIQIKPGGFLVLDNSERKRYRKGIALMNDWKREHFEDKWRTTIFHKPKRGPQ